MTGKKFYNKVTGIQTDAVSRLLALLKEAGAQYCVIGGLAVNAYAEPVVSLDLDLVVVADKIDVLITAARKRGMGARRFEHSVNLTMQGSDLRIQIQTDPRYQAFIARARRRDVLGYPMSVARIEDVFQGKLWASADATRRGSKRLKDVADILRIAEKHPGMAKRLPREIAGFLKQ